MARLRYSSDQEPGFARRPHRQGFQYFDSSGKLVRDRKKLARFELLKIPPAWKEVWISRSPSNHLQATGRDSRGRKQYRYHERWTDTRAGLKFDRMLEFASILPRIRRRVRSDLKESGLTRERVLATVVRLLDRTLVRVGNDEYSRANGSYGLTTIKDRHVAVRGAHLQFRFRGKSGKLRDMQFVDARLSKIIRQCRDLPGEELFQYVDDRQQTHDVTSNDVNLYLREISKHDFTAKDFRTWGGTALAIEHLRKCEEVTSQVAAKRNVNAALDYVAEQLGNTRAVCRKSYVHPGVLEAYTTAELAKAKSLRSKAGLSAREVDALAVLRQLSKAKQGKRDTTGGASRNQPNLKTALRQSLKLTRQKHDRRIAQ